MGTCGLSPAVGYSTGVSTTSVALLFAAERPLLAPGVSPGTSVSMSVARVKGGGAKASIARSRTAEESWSTPVSARPLPFFDGLLVAAFVGVGIIEGGATGTIAGKGMGATAGTTAGTIAGRDVDAEGGGSAGTGDDIDGASACADADTERGNVDDEACAELTESARSSCDSSSPLTLGASSDSKSGSASRTRLGSLIAKRPSSIDRGAGPTTEGAAVGVI